MKSVRVKSTIVLLALLVSVFPIAYVEAVNPQNNRFAASYAREKVDDFGYRFSFRLSDGVEALFIRGSYWLQYSYPTDINEVPRRRHTMYANIGFYYGKTPLGRNIVQFIAVDNVAFYPKWTDSAGYAHDLYNTSSMFMINDYIPDGAHVFTGMRIDEDPVSSYMSYFGGTFVFRELSFVLDDGTEIIVGDVDIELLKYSNELAPQATLSNYSLAVTFTADADVLTVTSEGTAPLIQLVDTMLVIVIVGLLATMVVLGYLHRKGKVSLPIGGVRSNLLGSKFSSTSN
ncbi:MAG: hypothetical protein EAX81_02555 [Candidatus Thorarchaeota archaeon]|nr:hypothetical protein [Candidatus Thorarchaeota archaeon]